MRDDAAAAGAVVGIKRQDLHAFFLGYCLDGANTLLDLPLHIMYFGRHWMLRKDDERLFWIESIFFENHLLRWIGNRVDCIETWAADQKHVFRIFTKPNDALFAFLRRHEVNVRKFRDRVPQDFIQGAAPLPALDMRNRNIHMHTDNRGRKMRIEIKAAENKIGLQSLHHIGDLAIYIESALAIVAPSSLSFAVNTGIEASTLNPSCFKTCFVSPNSLMRWSPVTTSCNSSFVLFWTSCMIGLRRL